MVTTEQRAQRLPPNPGTPSPTDNGRMSTMAKAEDHRPTDMSTEKKLKGTRRMRHIKFDDVLFRAAAQKAYGEGTTVGVVLNRLLREYVGEDAN